MIAIRKEMILLYCRKCRAQIPDDSVFCLKCGEKVINIDKQIGEHSIEQPVKNAWDNSVGNVPDDASINNVSTTGEESKEQDDDSYTENKNYIRNRKIGIFIGAIIIFIIALLAINQSHKCSSNYCDNPRADNSKYCSQHTCSYSGCYSFILDDEKYCYQHEIEVCCSNKYCDSPKVNGGEYCSSHTCKNKDCFNERFQDTDYCYSHQVNIRERLTNSYFSFDLNSVGGIEFDFDATNSTGKEIKYVRFKVELYNAVGDRVKDEIKRTTSVDVEIIGPISSGRKVWLFNEIIGYCSDCAKIRIGDITIVYTDGSSETGSFNYSYTK